MTRTIDCDKFREIFKIDRPCCASCHDEADVDDPDCVINSGYVILTLPDGENVLAELCCSMLHTKTITRRGK